MSICLSMCAWNLPAALRAQCEQKSIKGTKPSQNYY